jgi:hypothetical protein
MLPSARSFRRSRPRVAAGGDDLHRLALVIGASVALIALLNVSA